MLCSRQSLYEKLEAGKNVCFRFSFTFVSRPASSFLDQEGFDRFKVANFEKKTFAYFIFCCNIYRTVCKSTLFTINKNYFQNFSSGNHLKAYRAVEQFRLLEHGKANSSERKQRIYCNNNNSLLYNSPLSATLLLYSHKLMLSILFQED